MTREEARAILADSLDKLGEHFDAVQIHASWMNDGAGTDCVHLGSGNFYARESMSREFIEHNKSGDAAQYIAQELHKEDE